MNPVRRRQYRLGEAPFLHATGRGVCVAIIDSGIAPAHPHVGAVRGGIWLQLEGEAPEYGDQLGHGTAVAAAVREKAPDAELLAVRVFDRQLVTNASIVARAIEWAAGAGAHLINVSMGTLNAAHAERLCAAVERAEAAGALVLSASVAGADPVWPGVLPAVVGVDILEGSRRDAIEAQACDDGTLRILAAPFPRPIPGVAPDRNLLGVSFAVANATGFLARLRQTNPAARTVATVRDALLGRSA